MQNAMQKFRQSSIVFEKADILSENSKTLTSSAETAHTFSTYHCQKKAVWDFFYFI